MSGYAVTHDDHDSFFDKNVLLRCDYNIPIVDGRLTSTVRIDATVEFLNYLLAEGAKITIVSHLGRPQEGSKSNQDSLLPIAKYLSEVLGQEVLWCPDWPEVKPDLKSGTIAMAENVRLLVGETSNDSVLAQNMAAGYDRFILEAFATAHREHASNYGLLDWCQDSRLGPLFIEEISNINGIKTSADRPIVAVIGGAKISTKIDFIETLLHDVDYVLLGGGLANTFLLAEGFAIGASLCESEKISEAKRLMALSKRQGLGEIVLPCDVCVVDNGLSTSSLRVLPAAEVVEGKIIDIGPETVRAYGKLIDEAKTVLWNGPMGMFEREEFATGSYGVAAAISQSNTRSIVGGGDTLAVIESSPYQANRFTHLSTGGGAFLAAFQPEGLPVLKKIQKCKDVYDKAH